MPSQSEYCSILPKVDWPQPMPGVFLNPDYYPGCGEVPVKYHRGVLLALGRLARDDTPELATIAESFCDPFPVGELRQEPAKDEVGEAPPHHD